LSDTDVKPTEALMSIGRCFALSWCVFVTATPAAAQLTPAERAFLDRLDPSRVIAMIKHLSEGVVKTRSGAGAGSALPGSVEEKALAAVIEQEMKTLGLDVRQEQFPIRRYERTAGRCWRRKGR
jgi:hypothetical protein